MATLQPVASTSSVPLEKGLAPEPSRSSSWLPDHPAFSPINRAIDRFAKWRQDLNLPDPGTYENVGREVKRASSPSKRTDKVRADTTTDSRAVTHLNQYAFEGARAELAKSLSLNPAFNVTHSFTVGESGGPMGAPNPGTYQLGALYATNKVRIPQPVDQHLPEC